MATMVQGQPRVGYEERTTRTKKTGKAGGALAVALAAGATVALAIIGLAGGAPASLMAIGTIVFGGALFWESGRVVTRYDRLVRDAWGREAVNVLPEVGGGMPAEAFAGLGGIALGILGVIGLAPTVLCAVAAIGFGGALLLGGRAMARFHSVRHEHYGLTPTTRQVLDERAKVWGGGETFAGASAIALGIVALCGVAPVTLVLVALLAVGGALLAAASGVGARMVGRAEPLAR